MSDMFSASIHGEMKRNGPNGVQVTANIEGPKILLLYIISKICLDIQEKAKMSDEELLFWLMSGIESARHTDTKRK